MTIGICGLGTIGIKLVEYLAEKGFSVVAYNWRDILKKELLFASNLDKKIKYEKIGLDRLESIRSRVKFVATMDALSSCDLIIDSSKEDYGAKKVLYEQMKQLFPNKPLACTTSSLDLVRLASMYDERFFVGMHFFNPPTKMKLIELSYLPQTEDQVRRGIFSFLQQLDDKKVIELPLMQGYIVNRMLFLYINNCFKLIETFSLEPEILDKAMKAGTNMPMGPCELSDYVGNDVTYAILKEFDEAFPGVGYTPAGILEAMIEKGELGRKTKKGFFAY